MPQFLDAAVCGDLERCKRVVEYDERIVARVRLADAVHALATLSPHACTHGRRVQKGNSALILAAQQNRLDVVEFLVEEAGVSVNARGIVSARGAAAGQRRHSTQLTKLRV